MNYENDAISEHLARQDLFNGGFSSQTMKTYIEVDAKENQKENKET